MAATTSTPESGQQHEHRPHAASLDPSASASPFVADSCTSSSDSTSTSSDAHVPATLCCHKHGTSTRPSPPGSSQLQQQRCKQCTAESSRRWRRRHPWKTIWLSFVRRAYRKFGKEQLSRFDMRWKGMGVRALAESITREAGPDEEECTPQALAWADQEASMSGEGEGEGEEKCSDTDASSAGASEGIEQASAASVPSAATGEAAAAAASAPMGEGEPPLSASAAPSSPTGVPDVEGRSWVLTWPADMTSLDLHRLVLLGRKDALHRSRNSKRKRGAEAAVAEASSEIRS